MWKEINDKAVVCIHCGCAVGDSNNNSQNNQGNITIVNTGIGILQLISCGGFVIWWVIDIIAIFLHCYECADGGKLV